MKLLQNSILLIEKEDNIENCKNYIVQNNLDEFSYCIDYNPDLILKTIRSGFLPMSANIILYPDNEVTVFTPKLHDVRCIANPENIKIPKTVLKEAKKYSVSINHNFKDVIDKCIEIHGDAWLTPKLVDIFNALHLERYSLDVKFVSCEVWCDETIIAGEIGYCLGAVYTSLSGFYEKSGSGSVQLHALAKILCILNFKTWDLGMSLPYKLGLGGIEYARMNWIPYITSLYKEKSSTNIEDNKNFGNAFLLLEK